MYVHVHVSLRVQIHIYIQQRAHTHTHTHTHTQSHTHTPTHTHTGVFASLRGGLSVLGRRRVRARLVRYERCPPIIIIFIINFITIYIVIITLYRLRV